MDKTTLVRLDLEAGSRVIEELEQRGITIDVAAWLQDDETERWRLVISTPNGGETGVRPTYAALQALLHDLEIPNLDLDDFLVASPQENLIKDLKRKVGTDSGLHEIRLDLLGIGNRLFCSARIYRVVGDTIGNGARVRVKETGRLGTASGVIDTPSGPRYLVMYDLTDEDLRPMNGKPTPIVGRDHAAEDLDFLYIVRTGGWPEKLPDWLRNLAGSSAS